jgi:cell division protein FtsL
MRYVVLVFSTALILALLTARPAAASGDDEVAKLQARIEKLEAEIKALKQQVAKLTEQPANQKKPPTGAEVVIEIANEDDITIGEKKHTLSSLRKLLTDSPPREVTVRRADSTSQGLYNDMHALLRKNGYTRDSQLGYEEIFVPKALPSKQP